MDKTIIFGDIETYINEKNIHTPFLIGFSYKFNSYIFQGSNMFEDFFNKIINVFKGKKLLYFHNFSKFDGILILNYLSKINIHCDILNRDNSIYRITIKEWNLVIIDSYLLIDYSLEEGSEKFNKTFFKYKIDYENIYNPLKKIDQKVIDYLKNDLYTLEELYYSYTEVLKKIFNINNISNMTIASLVHSDFLKEFKKKYNFIYLSDRVDKFIRKSYIGGIVDIYKPFGKNIIQLDVNSMYPYVMQKTKYPISQPLKIYNIKSLKKTKDLLSFCEKYVSFIKCKIKSIKKMKYPFIALKKRGKLIQPLGSFIKTLYSREIIQAIKHKEYKIIPLSGYYFEKSDYIFKEYVLDFYNKRMESKKIGNKKEEIILKKSLVSIYGRFGIILDNPSIILTDNIDEIYSLKEKLKIIKINNKYIVKYHPNESEIIKNKKILRPRIDWAAITTAEARLFMADIKRKINIYYTDTDSIYVKKKDLYKIENDIDSIFLGKFKKEYEYKKIIFISLKTYIGLTTDNKWIFKAKGINFEKENINYKDWFNVFYYNLHKKRKKHIKKLFKRDFNIKFNELIIIKNEIELTFSFKYNKRKKIYNKKLLWVNTKPLIINTYKKFIRKIYIKIKKILKKNEKK